MYAGYDESLEVEEFGFRESRGDGSSPELPMPAHEMVGLMERRFLFAGAALTSC